MKDKSARRGRNPQTGEDLILEARRVDAHDHVCCAECGKVKNVRKARLASSEFVEDEGWEIQGLVIEFWGICRSCQRAE